VVEEFNRNAYDIIIASDEKEVLGNEEKAEEEQEDEAMDDGEVKEGGRPKKKRKAAKGDVEYGVSRGMFWAPYLPLRRSKLKHDC
jgi:ATP-dependent RNA helicase DDX56/DBP9